MNKPFYTFSDSLMYLVIGLLLMVQSKGDGCDWSYSGGFQQEVDFTWQIQVL